MIDIIYQVDGIYSRPKNLGENLKLRIIGSMIHTGVYFGGQGGTDILQTYQEWLGTAGPEQCTGGGGDGPKRCIHHPRGLDQPTADDACLNHLFTHTEAGGVLGVAIQASPTTRISGGKSSQFSYIHKRVGGPYHHSTLSQRRTLFFYTRRVAEVVSRLNKLKTLTCLRN